MAGASRPWRRRHVVRGYRLPPPRIADVARASSASTVVYSRSSCGDSRPLLQALVLWVSCGHTLCSFHALHALSSPLRSSLCTLRHRRARPRLAPVTRCIAFLSLFLCLCFDAIWKFLVFQLVRDPRTQIWTLLFLFEFFLCGSSSFCLSFCFILSGSSLNRFRLVSLRWNLRFYETSTWVSVSDLISSVTLSLLGICWICLIWSDLIDFGSGWDQYKSAKFRVNHHWRSWLNCSRM